MQESSQESSLSEDILGDEQKMQMVHLLRELPDEQLVDFLDVLNNSGWSAARSLFPSFLPGSQKFLLHCEMPANAHQLYTTVRLVCQDHQQGPHVFCSDHNITNCPIDGSQLH